MIDSKSRLVLKILAQECKNGNYKIVEVSDIILSLPKHFRMEAEAVKHVLAHLERQDLISIKYDDDTTFCLAIMPSGFELIEQSAKIKRHIPKEKKQTITFFAWFAISFVAAFLGSITAYFICKVF